MGQAVAGGLAPKPQKLIPLNKSQSDIFVRFLHPRRIPMPQRGESQVEDVLPPSDHPVERLPCLADDCRGAGLGLHPGLSLRLASSRISFALRRNPAGGLTSVCCRDGQRLGRAGDLHKDAHAASRDSRDSRGLHYSPLGSGVGLVRRDMVAADDCSRRHLSGLPGRLHEAVRHRSCAGQDRNTCSNTGNAVSV